MFLVIPLIAVTLSKSLASNACCSAVALVGFEANMPYCTIVDLILSIPF